MTQKGVGMTSANGRHERLLTMREVRERLRLAGSGALYRLIRSDPTFKTFKTGDGTNSPRLMRESALESWIAKREAQERP